MSVTLSLTGDPFLSPTCNTLVIKELSVSLNTVLTQKQQEQDENDKETFDYSTTVKGKTLNYTVDSEDYLERQILDPPTERLKLAWV